MPISAIPPPLPIAEVYIDESSTRHRYLVLGAVVTLSANVDEFNKLLASARLPELPFGEMKWTKVSQAKIAAYTRFVDVFFSQPRGMLDFHSAIIDTSKQRHQFFNQGSREIGFNKELFQLALKMQPPLPNPFPCLSRSPRHKPAPGRPSPDAQSQGAPQPR
jgi:hypothetical protein